MSASHNIGANLDSLNATGTSSSFPTGGPVLRPRTENTPGMPDAGHPQRFPERNKSEGRRPSSMVGSMHRMTPGIGPGGYFEDQMLPVKSYAPMRSITKDMTMSDKGPGSFLRGFPEPSNEEQAAEVCMQPLVGSLFEQHCPDEPLV